MKRFNKNLVVIAIEIMVATFACACMWGCSDKVDFDWSSSRSDRMIAAFVDDSFVVVTDTRRWVESTEAWNGSYSEKEGCGNDRMCVYNYRVQEDGPRWCDSVSTESGSYRWFQLTDSVIWAGSPWDGAGSFIKLWKIGEKPVRHSLKSKKEDCQKTFMPNSYRPWLDGTFIGLNGESLNVGGDSCQYVVLDTAANTITYKRLGEDLAWIKECDDVRAWGDDVVCMKKRDNESLNLLVNNEVQDSILVSAVSFWDPGTISFASLSFYGNLFYWAYVNSIDSEKWKIKLNPNVRPLSFPSFGELVDENKRLISY